MTTAGSSFDKSWVTCDSWPASPHYGNCYAEFDDNGAGNVVEMSTSTDGGATWGPVRQPSGGASGLAGVPVVQPNGNVVVPFTANYTAIMAFRSTDGGGTWSSTVTVSSQSSRHPPAGGIRALPLLSSSVDGAGKVYVSWEDCRFRSGCPSNDVVYSTSTDGVTWSTATRIPIDPVSSTVEHFEPGIGVDPATSGSTAKIAVSYYYYPVAGCSASTCALDVGIVGSSDGGATWSQPMQLAGPMSLSWLPSTTQGQMASDFGSLALVNGVAHPVFATANAPTGGVYDQAAATAGVDVGALTKAGTVKAGGDAVRVNPRSAPHSASSFLQLGAFPRTE